MAFHPLDRSENAAGWLSAIILTPICVFATMLRFYATKRCGRALAWDDFWAFFGLIFYIPYAVYLLMLLSEANGRPVLLFIKQDPKDWITMAQYGLMMNGLYGLQQTCAKFSLLVLYHRLFWVNQAFVRMVWTVGIVQGIWGIVVLLCHVFACVPVRKSWYPNVPGTCIDINLFFSIYEPINSAIDFIMAGMAIFILRKLSIHKNTKRMWGISILFAIGAFSGVIGIIKTVEAQHSAKRNYHSVIWNLVQMATSIICCCAPIYRSILPESFRVGSLSSWISQTFRSPTSRSKSSLHNPSKGQVNNDAHSESSKGSGKRLAKYQDEAFRKYGVPWEHVDKESNERELAWTEVYATNDNPQTHESGIAMRTMNINQKIELR